MSMPIKVVSSNRKAHFEYFLIEHFEAGIALQGTEIKSIRAGHISLTESYVRVENHQAWLVDAHIAAYDPASRNNHDPTRERRLLLHRKEIDKLWNAIRLKGMTVVPVQLYLKEGRAKLDIALAKGKKNYDKRDEIAKREVQRDLQRKNSDRD
jgi:SsrA-binding protein